MALIFVHGRGQDKITPARLKDDWTRTLLEAAKTTKGAQLNTVEEALARVRFPYYAKALVETMSSQEVHRGTTFEEEFRLEAAARIRQRPPTQPQPQTQATVTLGERPLPDDELRTSVRPEDIERGFLNAAWVHLVASFVDRNMQNLGIGIIDAVLSDVGAYLTSSDVQRAVDKIVANELVTNDRDSGPRVIVAHSLGTVVAFRLLHALGDTCQVDHLITLGCPLGVNAVLERLYVDGKRVNSWPTNLKAWTNVADQRDIVALEPSLDRRSMFATSYGHDRQQGRFDVWNVTDVNNDTDNRHGITGYLKDPVVATLILRAAGLTGVNA